MTLTQLRITKPARLDRGVAVDDTICELLAADAPVAIGVSGGKDSMVAGFAVLKHLRAIDHKGPVVFVHSDLGVVEWRDSLPTCERLAARTNTPLVTVRRAAGDMMDRWNVRWRNNVARYADLSCVKLILPWSTPSMRFCTSELKTQVICRDLVRRFPGQQIISATGVRRDESTGRKNAPISKAEAALTNKPRGTSGVRWNPLVEWTEADVYAYLRAEEFDLHEGYTKYGMSRISCAFCIMSSNADLVASASCPDNESIYRVMVKLEIASTFAFQGDSWLGDIAPQLQNVSQRSDLVRAKHRAERRVTAEERIPDHLLYEEGWPNVMPTRDEAVMLAEVRREVADAVGISIRCTDSDSITARYAELMALKAAKAAAEEAKAARRRAKKGIL